MAAVTGTEFLTLLSGMLNRANMSGYALGYYSFYPVHVGEGEFIFNSLLPTGNSYLQKVSSVTVTVGGSGYGGGETPNITFAPYDGGTGAAATALMATVNDISGALSSTLSRAYQFRITGANLIQNGDFGSGVAGWAYVSECNLGWHCFSGGKLTVWNSITLVPNNDGLTLYNNGANPIYYWGSVDVISGIGGNGAFSLSPLRDSSNYTPVEAISLKNITGTLWYGGMILEAGSLAPVFAISSNGESLVVDNITFCTGASLPWDTRLGNTDESFFLFPDASGNYFEFKNGISGLGFAQMTGTNVVNNAGTTVPYAYADINETLDTYTFSFWHRLIPHSLPTEIVVADWETLQLRVKGGTYVLYSPTAASYLYTAVQPTGLWHNIVCRVQRVWHQGGGEPE